MLADGKEIKSRKKWRESTFHIFNRSCSFIRTGPPVMLTQQIRTYGVYTPKGSGWKKSCEENELREVNISELSRHYQFFLAVIYEPMAAICAVDREHTNDCVINLKEIEKERGGRWWGKRGHKMAQFWSFWLHSKLQSLRVCRYTREEIQLCGSTGWRRRI